jgi:glycosyltransferase involved in cell wall biosynthesis
VALARDRGAATVFALHNLRYHDPTPFVGVDAVLVASHFAAEHYRKPLGLRCTVLPNLVDHPRVRALERRPTYVVSVNPTIEKGVGVFARIADELGRRRPDIPFLVVEARGNESDVASCGLDLRVHGNVFFLEHTDEPRRFWSVAKLCLLPSLVPENQPLVAIEAMLNGVPVLGSDRGGIPETLGKSGSVLPIPDRLTPASSSLPTADEAAAWVKAILDLWDSPEVYERRSHDALAEAQRWSDHVLEPLYERYFATLGRPQDG